MLLARSENFTIFYEAWLRVLRRIDKSTKKLIMPSQEINSASITPIELLDLSLFKISELLLDFALSFNIRKIFMLIDIEFCKY